jgi:hypothetical protein
LIAAALDLLHVTPPAPAESTTHCARDTPGIADIGTADSAGDARPPGRDSLDEVGLGVSRFGV